MVGAAAAKLRELKHVWTRGTDSKLESDERKLRDWTYCVFFCCFDCSQSAWFNQCTVC